MKIQIFDTPGGLKSGCISEFYSSILSKIQFLNKNMCFGTVCRDGSREFVGTGKGQKMISWGPLCAFKACKLHSKSSFAIHSLFIFWFTGHFWCPRLQIQTLFRARSFLRCSRSRLGRVEWHRSATFGSTCWSGCGLHDHQSCPWDCHWLHQTFHEPGDFHTFQSSQGSRHWTLQLYESFSSGNMDVHFNR